MDVFADASSPGSMLAPVLASLARGEEPQASTERTTTPSAAYAFANVALALIDGGAEGVYHIASPERVSRYEFARRAAHCFGLPADGIRPVPVAATGGAEPPLRSTCLRVHEVERTTGQRMISWERALFALSPEADPVHGPVAPSAAPWVL